LNGDVSHVDVTAAARPFFWLKIVCALVVTTAASVTAAFLAGLLTGAIDSPGMLAAMIGFYAVIGWAAWLSWKNLGVIEVVTQRFMLTSFFALFLANAGFLALMLPDVRLDELETSGSAEEIGALSAIIMCAFLGLLGLIGALALASARASKLRGFKTGLLAFMRALQSHERRHAAKVRAAPRAPLLGSALAALGFGWLVAVNMIPDEIYYRYELYRASAPIIGLGMALLIYARVMFEPSAESLLKADARPPILFLRSFADEEKGDYFGANFGFFDFSLETRLADHFGQFGPFIAIGSPKDKTPRLGAARAKLGDEEWRSAVLNWMDDAQVILALAGKTHWIEWELERVVERGHATKLITIFPKVRWWKRKKEAAARLEALRSAFAQTEWAAALAELDRPQRLRAIAFLPGGKLSVSVSRSNNRNAYHLAALVANYERLEHAS
jgi:hypothetical protein